MPTYYLLFFFLLYTSAQSDLNSTTTQTTNKTRKTTKTTVTIPYRCHRIVQTGSPRPGEIVPSHISHPPYAVNNGKEQAPEYVLIKTHSEIKSIDKSCSIAKSVQDKLKTYIRAGKTTEEIDKYAHELIIRRGAYPSYRQFKHYPKSITTSINNIVEFGKPDDTKLRSGDIITVDVSVYYDGYHGAWGETFLVDTVDFAGKKLVEAAREVTYAGINSCRPGESFNTLGRVIEEETKSRGFQVIPNVEGHGIGQFLQENPHILQFENNQTRSEETMQQGMVFTIKPAITDGKPECVTLFENPDGYGDNWTLTTVDGSRTAQFERTVLITKDGVEILGY